MLAACKTVDSSQLERGKITIYGKFGSVFNHQNMGSKNQEILLAMRVNNHQPCPK
jgi:hypothetical protein